MNGLFRALRYLIVWLTVTAIGGVLGLVIPFALLGATDAPAVGLVMIYGGMLGLFIGCVAGEFAILHLVRSRSNKGLECMNTCIQRAARARGEQNE